MFPEVVLSVFVLACSAGAYSLEPPLAGTPHNNAAGVAIPKLTLSWNEVPGAASYTVQMSTNRHFAELLPLEKAVVSPSETSGTVEYPVALKKPAALKGSTTYYWRVIANCPEKPPAPCQAGISETSRFKTQAGPAPFKLSQTIEGDHAAKPAAFKYGHSDQGTVASADFALQYRADERFIHDQSIVGLAYLEGVLKSHAKSEDTTIRPAAGVVYTTGDAHLSLTSTAVAKFEADQHFDARKLMASVSTTPSYARWAAGTAQPKDSSRAFQFLWEPTFGIDFGHTFSVGNSTETGDVIERFSARIDTMWYLNSLAYVLNLSQLKLAISDKGWLMPREAKERRNLFSTSLIFPITDKTSIGISFKHGTDAPEFKRTHDYGLDVGFQLGK